MRKKRNLASRRKQIPMVTSEIGSCYSLSNSAIVPVRLLNPYLATTPQVELPMSLVHAESLVPQHKRQMLNKIVERYESGLNDEQKQTFFSSS